MSKNHDVPKIFKASANPVPKFPKAYKKFHVSSTEISSILLPSKENSPDPQELPHPLAIISLDSLGGGGREGHTAGTRTRAVHGARRGAS